MRMRSVMMFGLGYLFGTKAGRERYQEISQNLKQMASSDVTRQALDKARASLGLGSAEDQSGAAATSSSDGQDQAEGAAGEDESDRPEGWEHAEGGAWVPEGGPEGEQSGHEQQGGGGS